MTSRSTRKASSTPLLILAFNRPDHTRQLISALRAIRPAIVYCSQDGPRSGNTRDRAACQAVTQVWDEIDWPCERHLLIRKRNLGCQQAVSQAITWFFKHVEAGIILEDDCIPHPTFFSYCQELLHHYADDTRIMHISGNSFLSTQRDGYRFSQYPHCWGWATWRRAWILFDPTLPNWEDLNQQQLILSRFSSPISRLFWKRMFSGVAKKQIDSWAIPWVYTLWINHGLSILPNRNLVTNIGFGADSTHTPDARSALAGRQAFAYHFPIKHPHCMIQDLQADAADQAFVYEQRTLPQLVSRARHILVDFFQTTEHRAR